VVDTTVRAKLTVLPTGSFGPVLQATLGNLVSTVPFGTEAARKIPMHCIAIINYGKLAPSRIKEKYTGTENPKSS
jgi:hypothetical protein